MPDIRVVMPPMSEDQRRMVDATERVLWIGAGTKTGKTVALALLVFVFMVTHPHSEVAWVGPWISRARTGYEHVRNACGALVRRGLAKTNDNLLTIELWNGSRLTCFTGERPESIYGGRFHLVVTDEATRMKEAALYAIRSTVTATGGLLRFAFNTDRGFRHWAIREFLRAKAGEEESYGYVTLPTSRSPYVRQEDVEQARRTLPDRVFRALYLAEVQADGAAVFRAVEACVSGEVTAREGALHAEDPIQGHRYVMGVDLARLQNWTVVAVMDEQERRLVYMDRFTDLPWRIQRERIKKAWRTYNRCRVIPDATGVGDAVVEELQRDGVPCDPFIFSGPSKAAMLENLIIAVEHREVRFPPIEPLLNEMDAFEYDESSRGVPSYRAPEGYHDDTIMALGLATWGIRGARRAATAEDLKAVRIGRPAEGGVGL